VTDRSATRSADRHRLLRQRRFVLVLSARTISVLGNAFGPIAVAFGVLGLPGATARTLSVVLAAQMVPQLGFLLLGGVLGDRLPRNRVLLFGELMAGAAYTGYAVMMATEVAPLAGLLTAAALAGTGSALLAPSLNGIVKDVTAGEDLQAANSLIRLGNNTSRIAGFVLAGATVAVLGPAVALAVDAATFFVSAVLLSLVRLPAATRTKSRNVLAELRDGWREFAGRSWLWATVLAAGFGNAATSAGFGLVGPVIAKDRLGGAVGWSVVLASYALGMVLGVFVAMRVRPRRPILTANLISVVIAGPLVALGVGAPLAIAAVAAFFGGIALDVFSVLWDTTVQREVPATAMSRVGAYEYLGSLAFNPVGALVAGQLIAVAGADRTMLGLAAVAVIAAVAVLAVPSVRRLPLRPEPA
jgi:hypothetical protein